MGKFQIWLAGNWYLELIWTCNLVFGISHLCGSVKTEVGTMAPNPLIIPVFLPNLGCPERCIFCNQRTMAPRVPSPTEVRDFLQASLDLRLVPLESERKTGRLLRWKFHSDSERGSDRLSEGGRALSLFRQDRLDPCFDTTGCPG